MSWEDHNNAVQQANELNNAWQEYQQAVDNAINIAFGRLHELGVSTEEIAEGLCAAPSESHELGDWMRWVEENRE